MTVADDLKDLEEHLKKFGTSIYEVILEMASRFHGVPKQVEASEPAPLRDPMAKAPVKDPS